MTAAYDPALCERLLRASMPRHECCECADLDAEGQPCRYCNGSGALNRHAAAIADQLEAARVKVADLEAQNRALQSGALQSFATQRVALVRELETQRDALRAEVERMRMALDGVRIYADRCDNSGPEDGGNYTYLTVAKELRALMSAVAAKDPNA